MQNRSNLLLALARQIGIRDPRAVLSVAAQEGLGGGVGDQGTSFGPFQLHVGGAFPHNVQGNRAAWAWSKPGLLYALNQIKRVAGNLQGQNAISAIVNRFERPAAPGQEIAKALAFYRRGGPLPSGGIPPMAPGSPAVAAPNQNNLLAAVLKGGELPLSVFRPPAPMPPGGVLSPSQGLPGPPPAGGGGFTPAELFYRNMALKFGKPVAAVPNHFDHVHAAYTNLKAMNYAIALAKQLGLRVGENPAVGTVHPVHVKNSYHYRTIPGSHEGEAIDVSGNPAAMLRFYRALAARSR